jgi:hypothetical protein
MALFRAILGAVNSSQLGIKFKLETDYIGTAFGHIETLFSTQNYYSF